MDGKEIKNSGDFVCKHGETTERYIYNLFMLLVRIGLVNNHEITYTDADRMLESIK